MKFPRLDLKQRSVFSCLHRVGVPLQNCHISVFLSYQRYIYRHSVSCTRYNIILVNRLQRLLIIANSCIRSVSDRCTSMTPALSSPALSVFSPTFPLSPRSSLTQPHHHYSFFSPPFFPRSLKSPENNTA